MVSIMDCGPTPSQQQVQQNCQSTTTISNNNNNNTNHNHLHSCSSTPPKSAVSQRSIEVQLPNKFDVDTDLAKRTLKLDLINTVSATATVGELEQFNNKSPKSPLITTVRHANLPHKTLLTTQVDLVEDRKTLRDALYQGIFRRHRRTIFALGSFLRMLKSRNSQYNTIRSSSEGEDVDEAR